MKLEKILDKVNSLEKNSFIKIVDSIKSSNPRNSKEIDKILTATTRNKSTKVGTCENLLLFRWIIRKASTGSNMTDNAILNEFT